MGIADRLNEAMKNAKFESQAALGRASGISQPTINRILKGVGKGDPDTATLKCLAAALGVSFKWLADGEGSTDNTQTNKTVFPSGNVHSIEDNEDNPLVARVRKVKLKLSAGITGFATEPEDGDSNPIYFRKSWLAARGYKQSNLIAIAIRGESMEPNLYSGDTVVVNTADTTPKDGDVYAINYEGEALVKRMVRDSGSWWLSSDNLDKSRFPMKLCAGDSCIVIGRVVNKQSEQI